ncbi:MAG TPA: hypothetical protein VFP87_13080, partial [Chitinophagaceae bacterium]|nr:hypothetical protein [Chitinophagaceae bacterium]
FIDAFFFVFPGFGQLNKQLCNPNETIVFAFQVQNQKRVSICKERNDGYLVRFGTSFKLELQFPHVLDSMSWSKFSLKVYNRAGNKQNAAMYFAYLHFNNDGVFYEVYDVWNSENDLREIGVNVKSGSEEIKRKGLVRSHKFTLLSLMNSEKIKEEEND